LSHAHAPARRTFLAAIAAVFALALLPVMASAHGRDHGHGRDDHGHGRDHGHPGHHGHGPRHHGNHNHGNGHHGNDKRDLTVMTQNLYLGSSLGPALEAKTPEEFVAAVAQIYATVQYTNFPQRAEAIAGEIQEQDPDLVGLQEVTNWTTGGVNPPSGYDFLAILESDLQARGLHYTAASISHNANIGPAPLVSETCPVVAEQFTCSVTLEDRDVILVNDDTPGLAWSNPQSGRYATQQVIESPVGPLSFDRGWATIDARLKGQPFRFVDTHLETEESPLVQEAQANEFLAGPGNGGTIVVTGDFNSASDGSTTTSYAQLTAPGKFRDSWDESQLGPGRSCCQESNVIPQLAPGQLNNSASTLQTRIDLILSRGAARSSGDEAELIGNAPFQATPPLWPSDHAGVVSVLHLGG
jgi:endonuclease/exonuclease/phosphatase family metal-dependent hydrolase